MRRALAILALARAYEVYENEYANDVLPGGRGDDDLPNLPYAVDANRSQNDTGRAPSGS